MHPAITLLGITQCLLAFLIPFLLGLLTWRAGSRARLWFAAGVVYSVYLLLLTLSPDRSFSALRVIQIATLWLYITTLIYFLLREFEARLHPAWILPAAALPALIQGFLSFAQAELAEQAVQALFVAAGDTVIGLLAFLLARRGRGRGFYLVSVSGLLVAAVNLLRAWELLLGSGSFAFTDFTWKSNLAILGHLVGIVFVNVGYAGVVLERTARKEAAAREGQRLAEASNQKIAALLAERDQMVMLNSQFATLSGMSVLTGAIIHEITQPVQALVMAIDKTRHESRGHPELEESLRGIEQQAADCIAIVESLRVIMSRGRTEAERVDLAAVARDVLPIIRSECGRRGIVFEADIASEPLNCLASAVLYKRIIINLASNAIDALNDKAEGERRLAIALLKTDARAILEVADNSGKGSEIETLTFETLVTSNKPTGMGLGLMLCAKIADSWRGRLTAAQDDVQPGRSVFTLELPLAPSQMNGTWKTPE